MYKKVIFVFSLVASGFSNAGDISGKWNCHLASEYAELDLVLDLKTDGEYEQNSEMFGNTYLDRGDWKVVDNTLVLSRTETGKNGKSKPSSLEFKRKIEKAEASLLVLKHGGSTTTCKK